MLSSQSSTLAVTPFRFRSGLQVLERMFTPAAQTSTHFADEKLSLFRQLNIPPDRRLGQGEDGRAALAVPAPRVSDLEPLRRALRNHFAPATSF